MEQLQLDNLSVRATRDGYLDSLPWNLAERAHVGSILAVILASLTLGLIISTIAKTQLKSMQMTVFVLLPSILFSGFMFPFEAMPEMAQTIAEVLPATHLMRMIRAVVLRGAEVTVLVYDSLWLLGYTALGLLVAAKRFNKSLD